MPFVTSSHSRSVRSDPIRIHQNRMSETADSLTPKEMQEVPGYDVSSTPPPLYSHGEEQPPPYSADPTMHPPPNIRTTCNSQSTPGYESCSDVHPADTTSLIASASFDDKTVRRPFVRKVFSILTLQLLFTVTVVCVFTSSGGETNMWAYLTSLITCVVVAMALNNCNSFSRRHPWNIMARVVVTLSLSYMVGTIASFHDTAAVVITMGATLVISVAIVAFLAHTHDFSLWHGLLLILTVDLIMFGFLHLLLLRDH